MFKDNYCRFAFLGIICFFGCNFPVHKDTEQVNTNEYEKHLTILTFEKMQHQFGDVKYGEIVGCYFRFKNEGNHPLVINGVKPGCGCTTVDYPKEPILPSQTGEIEVRFDSKGFSGFQYKVITVNSNIKNKKKELVISANVIN